MDRPIHSRRRGSCAALIIAVGLLGAPSAAHAQAGSLPATAQDLTLLSLEELMGIEVTSVSKRAEPLSDAAAAVAVVTGDEIRRAGARNLAEALRLIPGLEVAATSAQGYAISARGFNSTSSDKLEVLLDGRSVYTPLFSGVFWDSLRTYLPDIERIEVIRGPGAALWGANAVNGVINIVTKPASETLGTQVNLAAGTQERGYAAVRTGSRLGDASAIRIYGLGREIDRSERADGREAVDGARFGQFGVRSDSGWGDDRTLTLSGDFYDGTQRANDAAASTEVDYDVQGANLLARWVDRNLAGGTLSLQASYDHSDRRQPTVFAETRDTVDLQAQHARAAGARHYWVYGLGYRHSQDRTGEAPDYAVIWDPAQRTLQTWSAFVQDQIRVGGDAGTLTLGSKFEYNDFTGFEFQPNARLGWRWSPALFTWASLSRAVRTPNRLDSDLAVFCPPPDGFPPACGPGVFRIGNPDLESEKLHALEGGLRAQLAEHLSLDLVLFYNRYSDLRSTERDVPFFGSFANRLRGEGYGAETTLAWQVARSLSLQASYAWLQLDLETQRSSSDNTSVSTVEGSSPRHRAWLRAAWQPAPAWSVDGFLRYVGALDNYDVPAYTELTLRTAWHPLPQLELAIVGSHLLDDRHAEWNSGPTRAEVERAVLFELSWRWQ